MDEKMTYEELYAQLCKAEAHIVYLEHCIRAASLGLLPENPDVRQQLLAIKHNQLKHGLHKLMDNAVYNGNSGYIL